MRLATWNINGLRARLEYLTRWLRTAAPDVVGLQELKLTDEQFPHEVFTELGYHAAVFGQKAWNGVAVLARSEPEVVQRGLPGQDELGARLLTVAVAGLSFTTIYCPNGKHLEHEDFGRKLEWFDALAAHLAATTDAGEPLVVCGDFNICPEALDSWNEAALAGSIFHTDAERERLRRLFDWGLVDVFRRLHPDQRAYSWWDYRGGAFHRRQGLRIDLLLASEPLLGRVRMADIHRDWRKKQDDLTPSDHAPVVVDLD